MKYIDEMSYTQYLHWLLPHVKGIDAQMRQAGVQVTFRYWQGNGKIDPKEFEQANVFVRDEISREAGEKLMTLEEAIMARGFEQGLEQGREKQELEIVKKLLQRGMASELICDVIGLSIDKIREIQSGLETD